jgi:hypothetical protein
MIRSKRRVIGHGGIGVLILRRVRPKLGEAGQILAEWREDMMKVGAGSVQKMMKVVYLQQS